MNELVKALGKFVNRDVPYVIGGYSVILCFLYLFDIDIPKEISLPFVLFSASIAHIIGYAIQDSLSFTGITNTSMMITPRSFMKKLFKRWAMEEWNVPDDFDFIKTYLRLYSESKTDLLSVIERILFMKQIGTTMGSSFFVCAILLLLKAFNAPTPFHISMFFVVMLFSIVLIVLGWLQAMQLQIFLYRSKNILP